MARQSYTGGYLADVSKVWTRFRDVSTKTGLLCGRVHRSGDVTNKPSASAVFSVTSNPGNRLAINSLIARFRSGLSLGSAPSFFIHTAGATSVNGMPKA
jgi:hypothetical protein